MTIIKQNKFFLFLLILTSCYSKTEIKKKRLGFYYWNTVYKSTTAQTNYLKETKADLLYVRLFDVDTILTSKGIEAAPISILRLHDSLPRQIEIVPVIFFTRQAIKSIKNMDSFVSKLSHLVYMLSVHYKFTYSEIQWDFDWTPSTKAIYFDLLKHLKQQPEFKNKKFSATIRLHQVKFISNSGIPPVDKGLLMCYNMGNLKSYHTENSIINLKTMKEYLGNLDTYPLNLDIALPLFSWILHFRNKSFMGIVRVNDSLLKHTNLIHTSSTMYRVQSDFRHEGYSFLKDDDLRFEAVDMELLQNSIHFLRRKNNSDTLSILFFNLDDQIISNYPSHELQRLYNSY